MAYQRRGRRMSRRRRRTRRRGIRRPSRAISLWPRKQLVKLPMAYTLGFATTGGTITVYTIKANSVADPTGALSTELPLGMDQWANMYQKFAVVASEMFIRVHALSGTGSLMYGISLRNSSTTQTPYQHYLETPMTRSKMLTPDMDHSAVGMSYKGKKFWKVRKWLDAEDQHGTFSATAPTDPNDVAYYHIWAQDTNAADSQTLEIVVTMNYYVLLFEPIVPARSAL